MGVYTIPTKNALQTSLSSSLSDGETGSLSVADDLSTFVSDISATRPLVVVVDRIDADGTKTPTKREYILVTGVSGTTWSGLTRGINDSTAQSHNAGAIVEIVVDAGTIKSIVDTFLVEHSATGTHSFSGTLSIAGTDSASAELRLAEDTDNGTNYVGLKAPATITTSFDLILPDTDGDAGQVLKTDGSGVLGWVDQYAPEGFLINGKIVPSVTSNNLTVAIKGMDGNDPGVSNPVYVRIGNTVRTITSALSKSLSAGANWFNAGGSELATKEIDYFVYLGYNATDGVVIGFSRIPYGRLYSDFSATTTNEKYCAISTITNAAAGDNYVNIGRFAATLSAGAGYTWTVPTFTATNLIQRPIYKAREITTASGLKLYIEDERVIIAGWGYWTATGSDNRQREQVTYPITFSSVPTVVLGLGGYKASDPASVEELVDIAGSIGDYSFSFYADTITTTSFYAGLMIQTTNLVDNWRLGYNFIITGKW